VGAEQSASASMGVKYTLDGSKNSTCKAKFRHARDEIKEQLILRAKHVQAPIYSSDGAFLNIIRACGQIGWQLFFCSLSFEVNKNSSYRSSCMLKRSTFLRGIRHWIKFEAAKFQTLGCGS
jgi:hypothetical protein